MSPSPYLTAAIGQIYRITSANPPPPPAALPPPACEGVLPVGAGPGRSAGEAGAQTDAAFGGVANSREARPRRGAAGVVPSSQRASGTSAHRHTVVSGHTRTRLLALETGFCFGIVIVPKSHLPVNVGVVVLVHLGVNDGLQFHIFSFQRSSVLKWTFSIYFVGNCGLLR